MSIAHAPEVGRPGDTEDYPPDTLMIWLSRRSEAGSSPAHSLA